MRRRLLALAAAVACPALAGAQLPILHGATFFDATATGDNDLPDAIDGGGFRGSWRTNQGVANQYAGFFLRDVPDASYAAGTTLNPAGSLQATLALGANTFYAYSSGSDRLGRPNYGLNLFFGAGPQTNCAEAPLISAYVAPGAASVPLANGSATTTTQCLQPNSYIAGANSLSFLSGQYLVTLTDFRVLAESDVNSPYDRASQTAPSPDGILDMYSTFTLTVTAVTATPEPSTYLLLASGLLGVLAMRRRREAAA